MPLINWTITDEDDARLMQVVDRAKRELDYPDEARILMMDLWACHSNGCPLDFAGLLTAHKQDFSHDIYGIRKAIDRDTGKLTKDVFMPRYALANRVAESHDGFGIRDEDSIDDDIHEGQPPYDEDVPEPQVTETGRTIDITPEGCKTPEGNARVNKAMKEFEDSTAEVANAATQFSP